jgi:hypothetical protein
LKNEATDLLDNKGQGMTETENEATGVVYLGSDCDEFWMGVSFSIADSTVREAWQAKQGRGRAA